MRGYDMMKKFHLLSGLAMVLVFVLSGLYLKSTLPSFEGVLDGNRMMWRASHIYMMMSATVNVMSGIYYRPFPYSLAAWLQRFGSMMVIVSQAVLLAAFAVEPARNMIERPFTLVGCVLLLFGAFFVFLGWCCQSYKAQR